MGKIFHTYFYILYIVSHTIFVVSLDLLEILCFTLAYTQGRHHRHNNIEKKKGRKRKREKERVKEIAMYHCAMLYFFLFYVVFYATSRDSPHHTMLLASMSFLLAYLILSRLYSFSPTHWNIHSPTRYLSHDDIHDDQPTRVFIHEFWIFSLVLVGLALKAVRFHFVRSVLSS